MLKLKLQHFGHLMWRADSFEKTLMPGQIEGRRRRGRNRMRWLDGITDPMHMGLVDSGICWWMVRPGVLWSMESQRVRHDWATELNWTELGAIRHETLGTSPEGTVHNLENKIWSWGWKTDPRLFPNWRLRVACFTCLEENLDKNISLSYWSVIDYGFLIAPWLMITLFFGPEGHMSYSLTPFIFFHSSSLLQE